MTEPTGGTPPLPPQEPPVAAVPPVAATAPAAPAPAVPAASSWQVPPPSAGATAERLGIRRVASFDRRPIAVFRPRHMRSLDFEP